MEFNAEKIGGGKNALARHEDVCHFHLKRVGANAGRGAQERRFKPGA